MVDALGTEISLLGGTLVAKPLLRAAEARRAYGLVSLAHPEMTSRQWDAVAKRAMRPGRGRDGGLMAIQNGRGYVYAVFRYAVVLSPLAGGDRLLRLQDVVLARLPGSGLIAALAACAKHLAAGLGCSLALIELLGAAQVRDGSEQLRNGKAEAAVAAVAWRDLGLSVAGTVVTLRMSGSGVDGANVIAFPAPASCGGG